MAKTSGGSVWKWWGAAVGVIAAGATVAGVLLFRSGSTVAQAREPGRAKADPTRVSVTRLRKDVLKRMTTQPATVQSFETVQLFARVSGYLASQTVDIGSPVKKEQELARIAVPELDKQAERTAAAYKQAVARVAQMNSRLLTARADRDATLATIRQAEAAKLSAEAWLRFREKQLQRMRDLFALKSIDERLVDESQERFEAATETARSAAASLDTARAQWSAAEAKIKQAEADVAEADAEVLVARADWEKADVLVKFATIRAPFDGIVTQRCLFPGSFVRTADGGAGTPLLTVERTDVMRVVVQIPDREAPFADPGDLATFEVDALPGRKFEAPLARVARSADTQTRLMQAEIDLKNPKTELTAGMYGLATITLDRAEVPALPCSCLAGPVEEGKGTVFVVRDGRARLVPVRVLQDDGVHVAVTGLSETDSVIDQPPAGLRDGARVVVGE